MPDLNKGQHRCIPVVLECPLTDVLYSAHVPVVQQVGQFGRWGEMLVETVGQLHNALFQFLPSGGVNGLNLIYYIRKEEGVDKGVRKAANFVFNMLRYQVVKYFGLFNLLYKQFESIRKGVNVDEVNGIEALLLRPEYSADTRLGRQVSDIGASFNVVKYYDIKENNPDNSEIVGEYYNQLDDYEKYNITKINQIL